MSNREQWISYLTSLGARLTESDGVFTPFDFGDTSAEYNAVRTRAGVRWRWERSIVELTGADRAIWLQGMVTNDVRLLGANRPVLDACVLDRTGHIQADIRIIWQSDRLLLDVPRDRASVLQDALENLIVMEDVTWTDRSADLEIFSVQGPDAGSIVHTVAGVTTVTADYNGFGGFDIITATNHLVTLHEDLLSAGASPLGDRAAEVLRVEAGIPKFGVDMDETTFPMEAGILSSHVHLAKGCYVGQEIVARIVSRGQIHKTLCMLRLGEGGFPAPGDKLESPDDPGREAGKLTSITSSPQFGGLIALGYVRNHWIDPGTMLKVMTANGGTIATVLQTMQAPNPH